MLGIAEGYQSMTAQAVVAQVLASGHQVEQVTA